MWNNVSMSISDTGFAVKIWNWLFPVYWLESENGGSSEMFCVLQQTELCCLTVVLYNKNWIPAI